MSPCMEPGIQHQLKPGGPKGIEGSTPSGDTSTNTRVVHCKRERFDVYIGRPRPWEGLTSVWGNPFSHRPDTSARFRVDTVEEAIACYEEWLRQDPVLLDKARNELRGKVLGCWCKPGPCHGDVIARLVDGD